ncbi:hypothetical protein [Lysobacter sp. P5_B9]
MGIANRHAAAYFLALSASFASAAVLAEDADVQISGRLFCTDGDNFMQPLAFTVVSMWDSDCDGSTICDEFMARSRTDADGNFFLSGREGDVGSKPDPYIRITYSGNGDAPVGTGPYVLLKDDVDQTWSYNIDPHGHNNSSGHIDLGGRVVGTNLDPGQASKCSVYLGAMREMHAHRSNNIGLPQPIYVNYPAYLPVYTTETPWTTRNTIHWRTFYDWRWTIGHEFGHLARHYNDGSDDHFSWDATRFRYGRGHEYCNSKHMAETDYNRRAYAFNEGWAHFSQGSTWGCGVCTNAGAPSIDNCYRASDCNSAPGVFDGVCDVSDTSVEGNVGRLLFDLSQCSALPPSQGYCVNDTKRQQLCSTHSSCNNTSPAESGTCATGTWILAKLLMEEEESIHTFEEFESKFNAETGCGLASRTLPLSTSPPQVRVMAASVRPTSPKTPKDWYANAASQLQARERAARIAAAGIRVCEHPEDCETAVQTLTRPILIHAEIELLSLRAQLASEAASWPRSGKEMVAYEKRSRRREARFRHEAAKVYGRALLTAAKTVQLLAERDRTAIPYAEELMEKGKALLQNAPRPADNSELQIPIGLDPEGAPATPTKG